MTTETPDPIQLYAQLNPLTPERLDAFARAERGATHARITALRESLSVDSRRLPRRRLVAAIAVVGALAIPALAFSGVLGSLFGFSNQGTPVTQAEPWIAGSVRALTGESPSSVTQLASRNGWTFYEARTSNDVCFYQQPPAQSESDGVPNLRGGDCKNAAGFPDFPSATQPILNASHYFGPDQAGHMSVITLTGEAADGVATVQVLGLSGCRVVAEAPVIDNVYIADDLPLTPESQVVGRDTKGNVVWHQAVGAAVGPTPPARNSCGLG